MNVVSLLGRSFSMPLTRHLVSWGTLVVLMGRRGFVLCGGAVTRVSWIVIG